jgi:hypothetical protein
MTVDQGSVIVDTSQLGDAPLAGYAAAPYIAPAGTMAVAGRPVAVIFFADASAGLSGRAQSVLHDVYLLQQQQGGRLRVVGHASLHTAPLDPARHEEVNYKLSATRANAVARALIRMGAPGGSISVVAEGSKAPVFYEFMPTGDAYDGAIAHRYRRARHRGRRNGQAAAGPCGRSGAPLRASHRNRCRLGAQPRPGSRHRSVGVSLA